MKRTLTKFIILIAAAVAIYFAFLGFAKKEDPESTDESKNEATQPTSSTNDREALTALDEELKRQSEKAQFHKDHANLSLQNEKEMFRIAYQKLANFETQRDQLAIQIKKLVQINDEDLVTYAAGLDLPGNQVTHYFNQYREALDSKRTMVAKGFGERHPEIRVIEKKAQNAIEQARKEAVSLNTVLKTKLELINREIEHMEKTLSQRQSDSVDLAIRQHGFIQAKETANLSPQEVDAMFQRAHQKLADFVAQRDQLEIQIKNLVQMDNEDLVRYAAGLDKPENMVSHYYTDHREAIEQKKTLLAQGLTEKHPSVVATEERAADAMKNAYKEATSLKAALQTKLKIINLNRSGSFYSNMEADLKDHDADLSAEQSLKKKNYAQAKEAYEQSRKRLRKMKIKQQE